MTPCLTGPATRARIAALARAAALASLALGATGCAPPAKLVTHISTARDQIKLLYEQGGRQGVLKCQVAADGALSRCRDLTLTIED
jgi:hypothetical protein